MNSGPAPVVITSLMQWAARSRPASPSRPARRRSTTLAPAASEPPAASYVCSLNDPSLEGRSAEQLGVELGPPGRAAREEADDRVGDVNLRAVGDQVEDLGERGSLRVGRLGTQLKLVQAQLVLVREHLLDPLAGRVDLEPVAGTRGDEGAATGVLLHP